ncbi:hypothetical protein [Nesterenkonia aerolata]|uniref:Uncharacterized protein n=1 Tax=Nesterenkonia aerolata TaxID=3074079 RepID=A0ABU2DS77_9MICC|nr:hypothetical protein [Nesterenkonia sp. LY-0111]MDR8019362.1 hypothetical protein [Nesterenkonia sp. LY-0111]
MISNGKVKAYSGQGNLLGSLIAFLITFGALVGSIVAVSFWTFENVWLPGLAFLALYGVAFFLAKEVMGRSDTLEQQDLHREHAQIDAATTSH